MAYETSIICDQCSKRYSIPSVSTKETMNYKVRKLGWTIGKKTLCSNCCTKRKKPKFKYLMTTKFSRTLGIPGANSKEIIEAENKDAADKLAFDINIKRFGDDYSEVVACILVDRKTW